MIRYYLIWPDESDLISSECVRNLTQTEWKAFFIVVLLYFEKRLLKREFCERYQYVLKSIESTISTD